MLAKDSVWNHHWNVFLRIGEGLAGCQRKDPGEEAESAAGEHSPEPPHRHSSAEATATGVPSGSQSPTGTSERAARAGSGLRRVDKDPDRYLHRILHWADPGPEQKDTPNMLAAFITLTRWWDELWLPYLFVITHTKRFTLTDCM